VGAGLLLIIEMGSSILSKNRMQSYDGILKMKDEHQTPDEKQESLK
jgi:hypothetical protein